MVELGQVGLDEGAIFESLRDPVWSKTVVKTRHNKAGLVTSVTTTHKQLTGSQGLALVLGPALLALIAGTKGVLDAASPGLLGAILDPLNVFGGGLDEVPSTDPIRSAWKVIWDNIWVGLD